MKQVLLMLLLVLALAGAGQVPAGLDSLTGLTYTWKDDTLYATTPDFFRYRVAYDPTQPGALLDLRKYPFKAPPPPVKQLHTLSLIEYRLFDWANIICDDTFTSYAKYYEFYGYTNRGVNILFCGTQPPPFAAFKTPDVRCITVCRETEINWLGWLAAAEWNSVPVYFTDDRRPPMRLKGDPLPIIVKDLSHLPPMPEKYRVKSVFPADSPEELWEQFPTADNTLRCENGSRLSPRLLAHALRGSRDTLVIQSSWERPRRHKALYVLLPHPTVLPPLDSLPGLALLDLRSSIDLSWDTLCQRLAAIHRHIVLTTDAPKTLSLDTLQVVVDELPDSLPACLGNVPTLTALLLSGANIAHLPPEIGNLPNLQAIDLSFNQLQELPVEMARLHQLTRIDISHNRLLRLPEELATLPNLRLIDARSNGLDSVPPAFQEKNPLARVLIHRIKYDSTYNIVLKNFHIAKINDNAALDTLSHLGEIGTLDLRKNPAIRWKPILALLRESCRRVVVTTAFPTYWNTPGVLTLWVSAETEIPDEVIALPRLALLELSLDNLHEISTLPKLLTGIRRPIHLINRFSDSLSQDTKILKIYLSNYKIIIKNIIKIHNIMYIDFTNYWNIDEEQLYQVLVQLHRPIRLSEEDQEPSADTLTIHCARRTLYLLSLFAEDSTIQQAVSRYRVVDGMRIKSEAHLSACGLKHIPPLVLACSTLTYLDLSHNDLEALPSQIGTLKKLKYLNITGNPVHAFPEEMQQLTWLETLVVSVGQFSVAELAKLRQWLPHCTVLEDW